MSVAMQRPEQQIRVDAGVAAPCVDVKQIAEANYLLRTQLADDSRYDWVQAEKLAALQTLAIAQASGGGASRAEALAEVRRVAEDHGDDALLATAAAIEAAKRSFFSRLLAS